MIPGRWRRTAEFACRAWLLLVPVGVAAADVSVMALTDDVYHFRYGFHSNLFVLTDEGVVVIDPLSPAAASACLAEIRKRSDLPIRYVIYSHDHTDHIAGGAVFGTEAIVVAHRNAERRIAERGIEEIVPPELLVDKRHTLTLGGKEIQLVHLGRIESASSLAVFLPQDRVLMWVDAVRSFGVPYRYLEGYDLQDFTHALDEIMSWDFDILVPGHGPPTDKERVRLYAGYLADLRTYAEAEMARYPQVRHQEAVGEVNPERFFDTYIAEIARRTTVKMHDKYGDLGGFEDWTPKNAERTVVFLLHEILFFE